MRKVDCRAEPQTKNTGGKHRKIFEKGGVVPKGGSANGVYLPDHSIATYTHKPRSAAIVTETPIFGLTFYDFLSDPSLFFLLFAPIKVTTLTATLPGSH